jgi:hypothetical protein
MSVNLIHRLRTSVMRTTVVLRFIGSAGLWFSVLGVGCSTDPSEPVTLDPTPYVLNTHGLPPAPLPPDVQLTKAKVQLGHMLLYD